MNVDRGGIARLGKNKMSAILTSDGNSVGKIRPQFQRPLSPPTASTDSTSTLFNTHDNRCWIQPIIARSEMDSTSVSI